MVQKSTEKSEKTSGIVKMNFLGRVSFTVSHILCSVSDPSVLPGHDVNESDLYRECTITLSWKDILRLILDGGVLNMMDRRIMIDVWEES